MRSLGPAVLALLWGGCHMLFPYEANPRPDTTTSSPDADGGPRADLAAGDGDAPASLMLAVDLPQSSAVRVGQHAPVVLSLSGHRGDVTVEVVASGGCLLAAPDHSTAVDRYEATPASPGQLEARLFAPPAVKPGAECNVAFVVSDLRASATLTVGEPEYTLVFLGSDAVQGMKGLEVTKLGALHYAGPVQGIVQAGGTFGGDFVVGSGTGSSGGAPVNPSTVRLYRFRGDVSHSETILPTLDLYGSDTSPTALDGLTWSDSGPCAPDAIYLAASYGDYTYAPDTVSGSITCVDSADKLTHVVNRHARSVSVVPTQSFFPQADVGSVLYASDSTTYLYPGYHTVGAVGSGATQMAFARAGPHAGHLYLIRALSPAFPLVRFSPPPGQSVSHLRDLNDRKSRFSLSAGGAFGPLVIAAAPGALYGDYHILALVEEGGSARELPLLQAVRCGCHFAMSSSGDYMVLLAPPADKGCNGPWSVYRVAFKLS